MDFWAVFATGLAGAWWMWLRLENEKVAPETAGAPMLATTPLESRSVHGYPCNVPIYEASFISEDDFFLHFNKQPFIVHNSNQRIRDRCKLSALLEEYGSTEITVSSSNTHSHAQISMPFQDYIAKHTGAIAPEADALNTWYFFGDQGREWDTLLDLYNIPSIAPEPVLAFGMGGHHSGVPLHVHGPVVVFSSNLFVNQADFKLFVSIQHVC